MSSKSQQSEWVPFISITIFFLSLLSVVPSICPVLSLFSVLGIYIETYVHDDVYIRLSMMSYLNQKSHTISHRWELPGNCPVLTMVMVIYHYAERIWRILVNPIFVQHIQTRINIIQVNQLVYIYNH